MTWPVPHQLVQNAFLSHLEKLQLPDFLSKSKPLHVTLLSDKTTAGHQVPNQLCGGLFPAGHERMEGR